MEGVSFLAALKSDLSSEGQEASRTKIDLKGIKVLVVDDNLDHQIFLKTCLESHGAMVEIANDADSGFRMAMGAGCDLILMDIQMSGKSGLEATKMLRQAGYEKAVIALSARNFKEDLEGAQKAGCNAYLTKPISPNELIEAVVRWRGSKESDPLIDSKNLA